MTRNPHFESPPTWEAARALLSFAPLELNETSGHRLQSLAIYVRDHRLREIAPTDRSLEAHFGAFSFTQARKGIDEARRWALEVAYGRAAAQGHVAGHPARIYELGPKVPVDDIDGRSPAVVVWHDGEMFYLIASDRLQSPELLAIAETLYR
jgi:hypothetical protein